MNIIRLHWFDAGMVSAVITCAVLLLVKTSPLEILLWLSLASLFIHQFEEYRYPGYFPGMVNAVLFSSSRPDRYPLNTNTAMIVNVIIGWLFYFLAAVLGERAIWLGIATMLVSAGNIIAHTALFNIKGKTFYNPGMLTSLFLFLPLAVLFFSFIIRNDLVSPAGWIAGILLGAALNYIGIIKLIDWMKDEETEYIFPERCLKSKWFI